MGPQPNPKAGSEERRQAANSLLNHCWIFSIGDEHSSNSWTWLPGDAAHLYTAHFCLLISNTFFPPQVLYDGRKKMPVLLSAACCPSTTPTLACLICEIEQLQSFKSLFIKCLQA